MRRPYVEILKEQVNRYRVIAQLNHRLSPVRHAECVYILYIYFLTISVTLAEACGWTLDENLCGCRMRSDKDYPAHTGSFWHERYYICFLIMKLLVYSGPHLTHSFRVISVDVKTINFATDPCNDECHLLGIQIPYLCIIDPTKLLWNTYSCPCFCTPSSFARCRGMDSGADTEGG